MLSRTGPHTFLWRRCSPATPASFLFWTDTWKPPPLTVRWMIAELNHSWSVGHIINKKCKSVVVYFRQRWEQLGGDIVFVFKKWQRIQQGDEQASEEIRPAFYGNWLEATCSCNTRNKGEVSLLYQKLLIKTFLFLFMCLPPYQL